MRKLLLYMIGILFALNSFANACNFRIANFGDPKENIQLNKNLMPVIDLLKLRYR